MIKVKMRLVGELILISRYYVVIYYTADCGLGIRHPLVPIGFKYSNLKKRIEQDKFLDKSTR